MKDSTLKILGTAILLLLFAACNIKKESSPDDKQVIGIWQSIPEVASGWDDAYQFFDNGKFIFNFSQMICDKRVLKYSGTWKLSDEQLTLTIKKKKILVGGELVPAMGSCGSEFEIDGGEVNDIELHEAEVQTLSFSEISSDPNHPNLKTATINGKSFWKMEDDPKKY